jgi:ACR3 family arsenite transporter
MHDTPSRGAAASPAPMNLFERYLTVWVFLCIVVGIALGQWLPGPFQALGRMELARVNLPVGLLIWVMVIPMLLKVDFGALQQVGQHWRGIGVTLFINWAVKPFSMALLGWIFVRHLFAPYLPAEQLDSYIAGLILLAAAPCTAMVFVWSRLTQRRPLVHALTSGAERHDHGVCIRADRRVAAGAVVDHRSRGIPC